MSTEISPIPSCMLNIITFSPGIALCMQDSNVSVLMVLMACSTKLPVPQTEMQHSDVLQGKVHHVGKPHH